MSSELSEVAKLRRITLRIKVAQFDEWRKIAEALDRPLSSLIRVAVEEYIDRFKTDKEAANA
jgi:predicted DNA-binding ribbon-helix-helix protein